MSRLPQPPITSGTVQPQIIWVMDSELCEECDALLDAFGCCPNCGWGELDDLYEDEDSDPDPDCLDFDEYGHYIGG